MSIHPGLRWKPAWNTHVMTDASKPWNLRPESKHNLTWMNMLGHGSSTSKCPKATTGQCNSGNAVMQNGKMYEMSKIRQHKESQGPHGKIQVCLTDLWHAMSDNTYPLQLEASMQDAGPNHTSTWSQMKVWELELGKLNKRQCGNTHMQAKAKNKSIHHANDYPSKNDKHHHPRKCVVSVSN